MAMNNAQSLRCAAPEDVFVEAVSITSGKVVAGQELMRLRCPNLDRFLQRLSSLKSLLDISERQFIDGRTDELLAILELERNAAWQANEAAAKRLRHATSGFEAGTMTAIDVSNAQADFDNSVARYLGAEKKLQHEPRRVADMKDRLVLSREHLLIEEAILNSLKEKLIIRSPTNGDFTARVGVGAFVKKGDICGELLL